MALFNRGEPERSTHQRPLDIVLRRMQANLHGLGGTVQDEPCRGQQIAGDPGKGLSDSETCGCGGTTRLALPYKGGIAAVCATCDCAYYFPRLREPRHEAPG